MDKINKIMTIIGDTMELYNIDDDTIIAVLYRLENELKELEEIK